MAAKKPFIINDSTNNDILFPNQFSRGLVPGEGFGSISAYEGVAQPFPRDLLIPRSEWQARIEERKARRMTTRQMAKKRGWVVKDQDGIPYCWVYAPTAGTELTRMRQGQKHVVLSPASAGAPIKNFRSVGGWGREALEWIVKYGLVPVDLWPPNAINRKYYTEENKKVALSYRIDEWFVLAPRSLEEQVSAILRGFVLAVGYNWWGHEVTAADVEWRDGEVTLVIANSWGIQWGDEGWGELQGSRMLSDDTVCPRTALAA